MLSHEEHVKAWMKLDQFLRPLLSHEDMNEVENIICPSLEAPAGEDSDVNQNDLLQGRPNRPSESNPFVQRSTAMDGHSAGAALQAIRIAEDAVRPYIGTVAPQRSAEAVYKLALDAWGVDTRRVNPSAYRAMFNLGKQQGARSPRLGADSMAAASLSRRFGTDLTRIKQIG